MHARKRKKKAGRRARKHTDNAWDAVEDGNLDLALKELRRALEERQDNPVIWNDYGLILGMAGESREAEKALRNAILIAPAYAEAHANLATLVAGLGRTIQATRLMHRAADLDPRNEQYRQKVETYEALAPAQEDRLLPSTASPLARSHDDVAPSQVDRYDLDGIRDDLTVRGYSVLPALLTEQECAALIDLFTRDPLFEKDVELEGGQGQGGSYRFFRRPLPETVQRVRSEVYAAVAPIANDWLERVGKPERFPTSHPEFLEECAGAGQARSTPILLRYRAPAVNHLHRDVWGRMVFPFQLAITLSPRARDAIDGFTGGAFVLADETPGRHASRSEIITDQGDGVLFCTRDRLLRVGASYALQPVAHGMAPLTAGERYVLGCPFHDYK